MVWNIVKDMFDNTDSTGTLIIKGWDIEPEETGSNPCFYKCRMNWDFDKAQEVAEEAAFYCDALSEIGRYFADTGRDVCSEPDFTGSFDDSYAAQLKEVWELFFGGYDSKKIRKKALIRLAEQRLGRKLNAHDAFVRGSRVAIVSKLDAPEVILDNEKYEFVRAYVLNRACEEMVCVDISEDSFDEKAVTLGEFDEDDINRIFEMLMGDCSIMPEERIGYVLLVNMIFGDIRLDLYRRYEAIKPAVDGALATLSSTERQVLEKLYGLTDGVRRTHEMTALELHIPLPMVREHEGKALRKLRHPNRAQKIEAVLDCQDDDSSLAELKATPHDPCASDAKSRFSSDCLNSTQAGLRPARRIWVI
ncbi:MAG: hypothetical protein IKP95_03435 [Ruminococcus sp.]|nr:hypothetical protein [Ruminococcus sp.]